MSDHLTIEVLESYRRRSLEPVQLLVLDDHLGVCAECRALMRELKPRDAAMTALKASLEIAPVESEHLSHIEIAKYCEERLDAVDRELASSHIESCQSCAARMDQHRACGSDTAPDASVLSRFLTFIRLSRPVPPLWRVVTPVVLTAVVLIGFTVWQLGQMKSPPVALAPSSPIAPSSRPAVVLSLMDGGRQIAFHTNGSISGIDSLPPADQQLLRNTLVNGTINVPAGLRDLRSMRSALMGSGAEGEFRLIEPVGRVVATQRPIFRWQPLAGAASYQLTISDPARGYKEVVTSPELQRSQWRPPMALPRGRLYSWQVTAKLSDREVKAPHPAAGEAQFKVMDAETARQVERAERTYAGMHVMSCLIYAEAGLLEDAERECQALLAANPDSELAKNLLLKLRTRQ